VCASAAQLIGITKLGAVSSLLTALKAGFLCPGNVQPSEGALNSQDDRKPFGWKRIWILAVAGRVKTASGMLIAKLAPGSKPLQNSESIQPLF